MTASQPTPTGTTAQPTQRKHKKNKRQPLPDRVSIRDWPALRDQHHLQVIDGGWSLDGKGEPYIIIERSQRCQA